MGLVLRYKVAFKIEWWYPTTIGFPTKKDHFAGVLGVPPFKETPM